MAHHRRSWESSRRQGRPLQTKPLLLLLLRLLLLRRLRWRELLVKWTAVAGWLAGSYWSLLLLLARR